MSNDTVAIHRFLSLISQDELELVEYTLSSGHSRKRTLYFTFSSSSFSSSAYPFLLSLSFPYYHLCQHCGIDI